MTERAITFDDLYNELPQIDNEDPEFLIDLFSEAKDNLEKRQDRPKEMYYLLKEALYIVLSMKAQERRAHHQLMVSLSDPGLEVLRYLPKIAEKIDFEIDFEPLWEYVNPNVAMALSLTSWNRASKIIKENPDFAHKLRSMPKKADMSLLDYGDERGLVAFISCDEFQYVIKNTLGGEEEKIAKRVAGIVGPEIKFSQKDWIIEDLLDTCPLEHFKSDPQIVGRALGIAMNKTHRLNIAYQDRFDRGHVRINTQNKKVMLIDWSSAEENGDRKIDIQNVVQTIKTWYPEKDKQLEALKSFKIGYR